MSDWGKGAANNQIGWGQAAGNATNNWGKSQKNSYAGQTDIVGLTTLNILYGSANYCSSAANPTPTVSNNAGAGVFSSTSGLVFVDTATGEINIASSTAGNYVITYTDTDAATATFSLSLNSAPSVTVSVSSGTICVGESTTITASGATSYVWSDGQTTNPITVSPTTTTNFTATGTDSNGCTGAGTTQITVYPLPTVSISGALTYCAGSSTTLDAGSFVSYLWSNGETTQTISATAGNYTVTVTDSNGCSNTSAQVAVSELPLDVATVTYSASAYCQMPTGALAVDGYYPLYTTESASNAVSSDGTSHTHVLNSITYYMPNDGVIVYHGTYSLTTPAPTITGETGTFSESTGNLTIDSSTGVITLNSSTVATYTVVYTTNGTCPNTVNNTITINALDGATFAYSSNSLPQTGTASLTTTPTTSGGVYSAYPSGLSINSSTGEIDLAASTIQSYKVFYETSGAGCPNSSTFDLAVTASYLSFQMLLEVPATGDLTFKLPATGTSFTIDWGDSSAVVNTNSGTVYHTYTSNGSIANYTVSIGAELDTGAFTALNMLSSDNSSRNSVKEIKQWGDIAWTSLTQAMRRCYNLDVTATDTPDLSLNPSLIGSFQEATSLTNSNGSIGNWDLSACTSLYGTFATGSSTFNVDVSNWNTSNITQMIATFQSCSNFNQDLSTKITAGGDLAWDVSKVTTMNYMFDGSGFNTSISNWNTSNVTTMAAMFKNNTNFNQPILTNAISAGSSPTGSAYVAWDVSKVSDFGGYSAGFMAGNTSFDQDISNWKLKPTGNIDIQYMFSGATSFNSDISTKTISSGSSPYGTSYTAWNMSNVNGFQRVFASASSFDQNLSTWSCLNLTQYGGHATFQNSGMSTANYTDTVVSFANQVYNNSGTPNNVFFGDQNSQTFDRSRGGGANFANAGAARDYLTSTLGWTISGDTVIN